MGCALWTCTFRVCLRTQRNRWQNMKSVPRSSETARSLRRPLYRGSISKSQRKYVDSLLSQDQSRTINHQKTYKLPVSPLNEWVKGERRGSWGVLGRAAKQSVNTSRMKSRAQCRVIPTWVHLRTPEWFPPQQLGQNISESNIKIAPEFKI